MKLQGVNQAVLWAADEFFHFLFPAQNPIRKRPGIAPVGRKKPTELGVLSRHTSHAGWQMLCEKVLSKLSKHGDHKPDPSCDYDVFSENEQACEVPHSQSG
jgi:hypothetical protein